MRARLLLTTACVLLVSARPASAAIPASRAAAAGPEHIVVMVFENHEADTIMGAHSEAPYFRSLAHRSVTLSRLFAITHPSLPNYLALTSGSTHGVHSDCTTCVVRSRNIVDQLERASIPWKAYMESMPGVCSTVPWSGSYAMKHDPFMYYTDIRDDAGRCGNVVPLEHLRYDLASDSLPRFAWITPNSCHDMHDCTIATGDRFLRTWMSRLLPALGSNGIVVVVFDEGVTATGCCQGQAAGGHIVGIIAGPGAGVDVTIRIPLNQYSILRLIEDAWGLPALGEAAQAPVLDGWQAPGA